MYKKFLENWVGKKMERNFFGSFQWKISGSKRTSEKLVLFFQMEYSKQKFVFHFFKAIFDTSFRPLRPFCGFCVSFVQTCGLTGLPV